MLVQPGVYGAASQTSQAPSPQAPKHEFNFVVLGDSQLDHPNLFNRVVNDVATIAPSFVVQVGDMINGYSDSATARQEWQRFKLQIGPLGDTTFVPVPGNHDVYGLAKKPNPGLTRVYQELWGKDYHHFVYRNSLFVVLNSDEVGAANSISGRQLRWLAKTLSKAKKYSHRFVFLHRPPALLKNAEQFHLLLAQHQVNFVFYGHHHHLHHQQKDGVTYIMTNAAATSGVSQAAAGSFPHFINVSVRGAQTSVAVVKADAVLSPQAFDPWDNYDLFGLTRGLAPGTVTLQPIEYGQDDKGNRAALSYQLVIPLNNSSRRQVQLFASCFSADDRWQFQPQRIQPVTLTPGGKGEMRVTATQLQTARSEATPSCTLTLPFQTHNGEWLQHQLKVQTKLP